MSIFVVVYTFCNVFNNIETKVSNKQKTFCNESVVSNNYPENTKLNRISYKLNAKIIFVCSLKC